MEFVKKMAGNTYVGFSNATCVSLSQLNQVPSLNTGSVIECSALASLLTCSIINAAMLTLFIASLSQVPVRKRDRRQKLCYWILHEGKEGV